MKTAYMWYKAGARTLEDVVSGKGGIKLTFQQEIGIRYYDGKSAFLLWARHELGRTLFASFTRRFASADECAFVITTDINERMPRSEATAIFEQIKRIGRCFLSHIDFISRHHRNVSVPTERRQTFPCTHIFRHGTRP